MRINDILNSEGLPNWGIIESIPEFAALKETQQSAYWHREGNVWNHTKNVVSEMIRILEDKAPFNNEWTESKFAEYSVDKTALIVAALCHDLGKATTTKWDDTFKEWKTKNHGVVGERITRKIFFDEPNIGLREKVCWLVRKHMVPHHVFDVEANVHDRMMTLMFGQGNILELCYLNYADSMGSINEESENGDAFVNDRITRILTGDFSDSVTRGDMNSHYYGYVSTPKANEARPTVHVMVGIAGSGKSTWIKKNAPYANIVSRDIVREELGYVKHGEKAKLGKKEESKVSDFCLKKAMDCLSKGEDIVIDNLNLQKRYRDAYHKDFIRFNPIYHYVYVEAPTIADNVSRRNGQIPESEIYRMMDALDFPEAHEYDYITLFKQTE